MTTLYYITHPSPDISTEIPIREWHISEHGFRDLSRLLHLDFWKEVRKIYTSTWPVTTTVAEEIVDKYTLPLEEKQCLDEINRYGTGLLPFDEFVESMKCCFDQPESNECGWEPAQQAGERIMNCITDIMNNHTGESVAIIGHEAISALFLNLLEGKPFSYRPEVVQNAFMHTINWDDRTIISSWEKY